MLVRADKGNDNMAVCSYKRIAIFCGKMGVYVVIYKSKDKNTTQAKLAELVGSPVAPFGCK